LGTDTIIQNADIATTESNDIQINAFQTYSGVSQVWNRSSSSKHKLSWYVSSVGLASAVVIPEQNFMSVSDVGQSIFQVTVVCPAGYSQVASD